VEKTIDARGLACPQPVILTRRAMREEGVTEIVTIVDNETSRRNVSRMAEREGYRVAVEEHGDEAHLRLTRPSAQVPGARVEAVAEPSMAVGRATPAAGPLVVLVAADTLGRGEPELGGILMRSFFHTLGEVEPLPDTVIFLNSGVRLVAEGSPVLEDLAALAERGVQVLACGTCLDYFALKDALRVGEISNMYTIAETLLRAGRVVHL
jgi:selenium metabolism protein YedF